MSIKRKYLPRFEGAIEGYVMNYLRQHQWKVAASMEHDDSMQEARLVFLRLASKYGVMDTPQHFMALFKTAWHRRFLDLARGDSNSRSVFVGGFSLGTDTDEPHSLLDMIIGEEDNAGYLNTLLREAPRDVITILSFFVTAPPTLIQAAGEAWTGKGHKRRDGNQMLCQLLGFTKGTDVLGIVTTYFNRP